MHTKRYINEFIEQKQLVVVFIANVFLAATTVGWLVSLYMLNRGGVFPLINFLTSSILFILFFLIRFRWVNQNYHRAFIVLSVIPFSLALYIITASGVFSAVGLLLVVTVVLATAIVLGVREAMIYTVTAAVYIVAILVAHSLDLITPVHSDSQSTIASTVIAVTFLGIILNIIRLGYSEITNSYIKAKEYAGELEQLNKDLDHTVKLRTKQLTDSYRSQLDSVYNAAVMGMITRPMLHDLATPLSSLGGILDLISSAKSTESDPELLEIGKQALAQMIRIVDNGRDLMQGRYSITKFNPAEIINTALSVLQNEFHKNNIQVETSMDTNVTVTGVATAFERILINLILNAVQELADQPEDKLRLIGIKLEDDGEYVQLQIRDSGRGIPADMHEKIFDTHFTSKNFARNFGFGLSYVQQTVHDIFSGKIHIDSEPGEYTEFTLHLHKLNHEPTVDKFATLSQVSN